VREPVYDGAEGLRQCSVVMDSIPGNVTAARCLRHRRSNAYRSGKPGTRLRLDLTQIKYFLALARTLNFTRAAEACNVTQPALTKSIQRLENEFGGVLLLRERSQTQLTELGRVVLPLLQQTFDAAENVRREAAQFRKQGVSPLRIAVGRCVDAAIVMPLVRELADKLPGLELTLREGTADEINHWLLHSTIDATVTADANGLTERAHRWLLFADPVVALLPAGHKLAAESHVETAATYREPFVGRLDACARMDRLATRGEAGRAERAVIVHRAGSEAQVQDLVCQGFGLTLSTERQRTHPAVVRKRLSPPETIPVYLAAIAGRPASRAADIFLKLARARDWAEG